MALTLPSGVTIDPSILIDTLESNSHQIRESSDVATLVGNTVFLTDAGNFFTLDLGVLTAPVVIDEIDWSATNPRVPLQFGTQIYLKILFSGDTVTMTDGTRLIFPGDDDVGVLNADIFQFIHVGNDGNEPIFELIEYFAGGSPSV